MQNMVRIGAVIIIGAIIVSMAVALHYYEEYRRVYVHVGAGEPVQVGPVMYKVEYEGNHDGNEKTRPADVFFKIRISATNLDEEETRMSGGQFFIRDEDDRMKQPVFGNFTDMDLREYYLQPGVESVWTTQYDIPFESDRRYEIEIHPTKVQSSLDIGRVCLLNC